MRFTYFETMCDIHQLGGLAKAAEESGFSTFALPDSIFYPKDSATQYPYLESGAREFIQDRPIMDPFVLAAYLAGLTDTLNFVTFVTKLAVRNPVLIAKTVASLAAISNNRFLFGVGLSPWPEDFQLCGQAWEGRGPRMNEMIEIIRGVMTGDYFSYQGKYYDIPAIKICPVPTKPVPFLIGGHSEAAFKRAALYGDGWMHAGGDKDDIEALIDQLQRHLKQTGRELGVADKPFEIHIISKEAYTLDGVRRLADLGVTDLIIGFRDLYNPATADNKIEEKMGTMHWYANNIIAKL